MTLYNFAALAILASQATASGNVRHLNSIDDTPIVQADTRDSAPTCAPELIQECLPPTPSPSHSPWWPGVPDGCSFKGKQCNGITSYKVLTGQELGFVNGDNREFWSSFNYYAPQNCILAPIGSLAEFEEMRVQAQEQTANEEDPKKISIWVGMYKSTFDAKNDNCGEGSEYNWKNLGGTPAAVCLDGDDVWDMDQPDGGESDEIIEAYAAMKYSSSPTPWLLEDLPDGGRFDSPDFSTNYGMYKCCSEVLTFPSSSCDAI